MNNQTSDLYNRSPTENESEPVLCPYCGSNETNYGTCKWCAETFDPEEEYYND